MKKIIFCLSLLFSSTLTQAQDQPLSIGLKAGINASGGWNAENVVGSGNTGFHGGAVTNIRFADRHAVQTELLYSTKGFSYSGTTAKLHLSYLELPVLYQFHFTRVKKGKYYTRRQATGNLFATAGPQLSVLTGSKITQPETPDTDLYAYTRPFDISAVAGLGYRFNRGITISANYALGLRYLHGAPNPLMPEKVKNTTIQASVSYLIPARM
ncbi:porin family protein [Adhaeribacter soli]|uniref:PorT family protein n=1 Tax=Adhaeribacter soli TaxID=2607655 RepID=A0A5N1IH45_9BACT|nr:porin family protein [Adhaeribacter soli]KAA9324972.1 PorT family protein [Adhaeribacter soli]